MSPFIGDFTAVSLGPQEGTHMHIYMPTTHTHARTCAPDRAKLLILPDPGREVWIKRPALFSPRELNNSSGEKKQQLEAQALLPGSSKSSWVLSRQMPSPHASARYKNPFSQNCRNTFSVWGQRGLQGVWGPQLAL